MEIPNPDKPTVYLAGMDVGSRAKAFALANELRKNGVTAEIDHMARSIKAQFKYADKIGAKYVAVIGESELLEGAMNVKNMSDGTSEKVAFDNACVYFAGK